MIITQILNTNAVIAEMSGEEIVLLGKNIGFKKKSGQAVDENLIEKRFNRIDKEIEDLFDE